MTQVVYYLCPECGNPVSKINAEKDVWYCPSCNILVKQSKKAQQEFGE